MTGKPYTADNAADYIIGLSRKPTAEKGKMMQELEKKESSPMEEQVHYMYVRFMNVFFFFFSSGGAGRCLKSIKLPHTQTHT